MDQNRYWWWWGSRSEKHCCSLILLMKLVQSMSKIILLLVSQLVFGSLQLLCCYFKHILWISPFCWLCRKISRQFNILPWRAAQHSSTRCSPGDLFLIRNSEEETRMTFTLWVPTDCSISNVIVETVWWPFWGSQIEKLKGKSVVLLLDRELQCNTTALKPWPNICWLSPLSVFSLSVFPLTTLLISFSPSLSCFLSRLLFFLTLTFQMQRHLIHLSFLQISQNGFWRSMIIFCAQLVYHCVHCDLHFSFVVKKQAITAWQDML